jgi:hypothetical protein
MRTLLRLSLIALLAPVPAWPQTTADGIRALSQGDVQTAERILTPLAAAAEHPDGTAQFFLARIFETGAGGTGDPVRACSLYVRAAAAAGPFARQAAVRADAIRRDFPPIAPLCEVDLSEWHDAPPALFSLGEDHWVRSDRSGFTIGFQGTEQSVPTTVGGAGWEFLPTRYTRLAGGPNESAARHFIEFRFWAPNDARVPSGWFLLWTVYEVSATDVTLRGDTVLLSQTTGPVPPTLDDADAPGRIALNADGSLSFSLTEPIPPPEPNPVVALAAVAEPTDVADITDAADVADAVDPMEEQP